ncbi:lipoyl(octanoyl) transferase LipB [Paraconexibacter sp.]|uniref:lipoyl(octanoyl) transferase LipB n=1 Tax=Paraconexibacter sp. TaxID=2949640 RepID=UPI00356830C7
MTDPLRVIRLGLVEYQAALALQQRVRAARQADAIPDTMLLLEHPPVLTRGRRKSPEDLPMGDAWYRANGIDVVDVDRGGKVTYHGPGQLVGYPIVRVTDVVGFVRDMEQAIISALAHEQVEAHSRTCEGPDFTGVWVEDRKIASIGVHVAKGVTTHGFAVNVQNDMQPWNWIVACGLPEVQMTSLYMETGRPERLEPFTARIIEAFSARLDRETFEADAADLGALATG